MFSIKTKLCDFSYKILYYNCLQEQRSKEDKLLLKILELLCDNKNLGLFTIFPSLQWMYLQKRKFKSITFKQHKSGIIYVTYKDYIFQMLQMININYYRDLPSKTLTSHKYSFK